MAVPTEALIPVSEHETVQQVVLNRLQQGKTFWKPLHARMDYGASMYRLMDAIQQSKDDGYRRYISNQPRTALDLAHSILTRNDAFWRIPLMESGSENSEMRRMIGKVERALQGMVYDLDELFTMRGEQRFWKKAVHQALLRGVIAAKVHITKDALEYRDSPLLGEVYDSRLVYPHFDAYGLDYVIIERMTTVGDIAVNYPEIYPDAASKDFNPNRRAFKIEYWSNNRPGRPGSNCVLMVETPADISGTIDLYTNLNARSGTYHWLIPPYYHGYKPHALPVVVVAVNGIDITAASPLNNTYSSRFDQQGSFGPPAMGSWWEGESTQTSEFGRGILTAIEAQVPQMNEIIATILHHFSINTFGQWVSTNPSGEFPNFEPGIEAKIALTPDERIERLQVGPVSPDAYRLVGLLSEELQNGTLSNILRAGSAQLNSGVLFQQIANAALNTLEPYHDGTESFGSLIGGSLIAQLDSASSIIGKFELSAPKVSSSNRRTSMFVLEFDPKVDLDIFGGRRLRPRPVFKPALPDDLATRIQAARFALDPRRPILSLTTVLENILQIEDPTDEIDRIWEDMANMDPVIVLEQVAQALERMNETEMAERIRDNAFKASFIQDLQFRQQTGNMPPAPGRQGAMSPDAGGGEFNAQQNPGGGEESAAAEGAAILGQIGERLSV